MHDQNQRPVGVIEFIGREFVTNILGWQGGAREGNRPAGGCLLLSVVADKPRGRSLFPISIDK